MYGLKVITHPPNWVQAFFCTRGKRKRVHEMMGAVGMMAPSGILKCI
jgi:hypothetical protein